MTAERLSPARLDVLSDRQLAFLRETAEDWLVAKAEDLPEDPRVSAGGREAEEVAALGRLVAGLRRGQISASDPILRGLVVRSVGETRNLDQLREEYDRELRGNRSWVALLSCLDTPPAPVAHAVGGDEDIGPVPASPRDDPSQGSASPWVKLDGRLSEAQISIVLKEVTGALAGRTGDLGLLDKHPDPEREVAEIAALARLAFWLARDEVRFADPIAREMALRLAKSSEDLNEWEELRERYESGIAEHEALSAFAGIFSGTARTRRARTMRDDRDQRIRALVRFVRNERRLREEAGLSQTDTAFLAGLHRTEISLLERHERMPRVGTMVRLYGVLGSDPWELLEGLAWELDGRQPEPAPVDRPGLPDARRRLAVPDPMWRFGLLLTRQRLRAGLAQGEVARMLRMRRPEISLIERGGRQPRLDALLQLASAVETPPADLLSGIHWVPGDTITGGRYVASAPHPLHPAGDVG